jgi:endonuclease/exonuclease/phosphatase (EEP) superfamily protein YafD
MTHARTWKDLQQRKLYPQVPLTAGREYHNAASHSDVSLFRQRQEQRKQEAQRCQP